MIVLDLEEKIDINITEHNNFIQVIELDNTHSPHSPHHRFSLTGFFIIQVLPQGSTGFTPVSTTFDSMECEGSSKRHHHYPDVKYHGQFYWDYSPNNYYFFSVHQHYISHKVLIDSGGTVQVGQCAKIVNSVIYYKVNYYGTQN